MFGQSKYKDKKIYQTPLNIKSDFDNSTPHMAAYSFGVSRGAYESTLIPNVKAGPDKTIPGPGSYSIPNVVGNDGPRPSMGAKAMSLQAMFIGDNKNVPGPGRYESPVKINGKGKY